MELFFLSFLFLASLRSIYIVFNDSLDEFILGKFGYFYLSFNYFFLLIFFGYFFVLFSFLIFKNDFSVLIFYSDFLIESLLNPHK